MDDPAAGDTLFDEAACGLLRTTDVGTILRVNRTFCEWLGFPREQLLGRRFESLLTIGGRIFHQTHWAPLLKMQRSLSEVKLEMQHADGRRVPMVVNAVARMRDGVESHDLAIFSARDRHRYEGELLKARERAETLLRREQQSQQALAEVRSRLELAIDAAQLFQWSVDLPGLARHYEPKVALLLGAAAERPVSAAEFTDHVLPRDREAVARSLDEFLQAPQGRYHVVFRVHGEDDVQRWIAAWGRLKHDDAGVATHLVGLMQDVTEQHRQRAMAEDRVLLAEQTLGIVGHDLRNPLAAIQMAGELLGLRHLDASQQATVGERIRSSTGRANRLIADLLDFTRARTGQAVSLSRSLVEVHDIARDVVAELKTAYPGRTIRHVCSGDARMVADGHRVAQALGNLVSNALTYGTPDGQITVHSEGLALGVQLRVHNFGAVIDPTMRSRIFEPMTRGNAPGHLRSVGLGLYIVREIVAAHGGEVDYTSSAADGTTFVIDLPRSA